MREEDLGPRLEADLEWLGEAPQLMDLSWWEDRGHQAATANLPGPVRPMAGAEILSNIPDPIPEKLGRYFEALHETAVRACEGIYVLTANRKIGTRRRTIGELDLLYETDDGAVIHREISVKFFLGVGDSDEVNRWLGPGRQDRLDKKLERLADHQLVLPERAGVMEKWPSELAYPDRSEVLLLGALFKHPEDHAWPRGSAKDGQRGFWCEAREFSERASEHSLWSILEKPWWLSPQQVFFEHGVSPQQVVDDVARLRKPLFVGAVEGGGPLGGRGFVVPNGWFEHF